VLRYISYHSKFSHLHMKIVNIGSLGIQVSRFKRVHTAIGRSKFANGRFLMLHAVTERGSNVWLVY
jgi:hypothetical protein